MDSTQLLVSVFGILGSSGALVVIVNGAVKYFSGTAGRERARNISMREQRNEAWADAERERDARDRADRNRNRMADYASGRRRDLIEHGVDPGDIPDWPKLETEPPQAT